MANHTGVDFSDATGWRVSPSNFPPENSLSFTIEEANAKKAKDSVNELVSGLRGRVAQFSAHVTKLSRIIFGQRKRISSLEKVLHERETQLNEIQKRYRSDPTELAQKQAANDRLGRRLLEAEQRVEELTEQVGLARGASHQNCRPCADIKHVHAQDEGYLTRSVLYYCGCTFTTADSHETPTSCPFHKSPITKEGLLDVELRKTR